MKKYLKLCVLVLALAAVMMLPAFAGNVTATANTEVAGAGLVVKDGTNEQQFTASYSNAINEGQYLVLMVKTDAEGNYAIDEDNADDILYVDQTPASGTSVSFNLYPKAVTNSVVLLSSNKLAAPVELGVIEVAGVEVSGTVTSWNDTDDAVIRLYDGEMTDEAIKADMALDTPVKALNYTATKDAISANADGERYDQGFSFSAVPTGNYKIVIAKAGGYVTKIVQINVAASAYDAGEIKLWLYGDVTYDGAVRTNDATEIYLYLAFETSFTAEQELVADVTQDGAVRTNDATEIYLYLAFEDSVFDNF